MSSEAGWLGRLALAFQAGERGTELARSSHEGPLRIQRVLYPEGPECPHVYLLHPPGGVVGGDQLETRIELGPRASVLCTTPAAQKLYRSGGVRARIESVLQLAEGATLEWLPSETLAFSAAHALTSTRVELAAGAAFIGWDMACYGMPARGEAFDAGHVLTRFEVFRAGAPLLIDSFELGQGPEVQQGAFGLRGQPVVGNLYAVPGDARIPEDLLERLREMLAAPGHGTCSVSSLGELLVVRALGARVEGVRERLIQVWQLLRPALLARPAVLPRVWAT